MMMQKVWGDEKTGSLICYDFWLWTRRARVPPLINHTVSRRAAARAQRETLLPEVAF